MGFSFLHILIIVLILVVLFGPNKIPKIGKSLGEGVRNFKKALSEEPEIDVTQSIKTIKSKKTKVQIIHKMYLILFFKERKNDLK
ncbi:MAG: twin-arginine translocase TatA/TatE family subunit [Bdellovibrionales bacterium]|nr:twin-arginine translocase TatA/TatE family subunit [Bdellovibrionales bacterium]